MYTKCIPYFGNLLYTICIQNEYKCLSNYGIHFVYISDKSVGYMYNFLYKNVCTVSVRLKDKQSKKLTFTHT